MSIEEKAKAYEEALERAKAGKPMNEVFPELKESEDERIRKNCIHFLELQKKHHADTSEIDDCIAYLEKQKDERELSFIEGKRDLDYEQTLQERHRHKRSQLRR